MLLTRMRAMLELPIFSRAWLHKRKGDVADIYDCGMTCK